MAQTALEGVLASSLNPGASSRVPLLEMATPCDVPLAKSSYFVCSQVRVPSASSGSPESRIAVIRKASLRKNISEFKTSYREKLRVSRTRGEAGCGLLGASLR